jgi:hypothetical protein
MEQDQLLERFHKAFAEMKQELGFKVTFEELNDAFFLDDHILHYKYVSPTLSRSISGRIRDSLNNWIGYLHGLLLPNPSSMINHAEHQLFDFDEKHRITETIHKFLELTSRGMLIGLKQDKAAEGKYFDDAIAVWNDSKVFLIEVSEKVNNHWAKPPVKPKA